MILIIDGQGGKMGRMLTEQLKALDPTSDILAIGTNSLATAAMLKGGADRGATGENPVIVNAKKADVIVGPIGIIIPDAILGEITPRMAEAVGASSAKKILIPVPSCNVSVCTAMPVSLNDAIRMAAEQTLAEITR